MRTQYLLFNLSIKNVAAKLLVIAAILSTCKAKDFSELVGANGEVDIRRLIQYGSPNLLETQAFIMTHALCSNEELSFHSSELGLNYTYDKEINGDYATINYSHVAYEEDFKCVKIEFMKPQNIGSIFLFSMLTSLCI